MISQQNTAAAIQPAQQPKTQSAFTARSRYAVLGSIYYGSYYLYWHTYGSFFFASVFTSSDMLSGLLNEVPLEYALQLFWIVTRMKKSFL